MVEEGHDGSLNTFGMPWWAVTTVTTVGLRRQVPGNTGVAASPAFLLVAGTALFGADLERQSGSELEVEP